MSHRKSAFTLIELLVSVAVIAVLIALFLPAIQQARSAARRTGCRNNFKQVGLALQNYHASHLTFPPGVNFWVDSCGVPGEYHGWGWGSLILPFLEQQTLYNQFDFAAGPLAAVAPVNFQVGGHVVGPYVCPDDPDGGAWVDCCNGQMNGANLVEDLRATSMSGVADSIDFSCADGRFPAPDRNGTLYQMSRVRIGDIRDGSSNTLMVGEITGAEGANPDQGPAYFQEYWLTDNVQDTAQGINGPSTVPGGRDTTVDPVDGDGGNRHHEMHRELGFSSYHPGGCHFLLADGSVQFLSENIDFQVLANLSTRAGSEVVGAF